MAVSIISGINDKSANDKPATNPSPDDYPQAARKHLLDAMVLEAAERFDGAAYLSGYVVECVAKALIQVETGQVRHTHELDELRESLNHQAGASDVRTRP